MRVKPTGRKQNRGIFTGVLFAASVALGVLALVRVYGLHTASARAESVAAKAATQSTGAADDLEEHVAKLKAVAAELKKKNLFAPAPPRKNPVSEVKAIMGSEAFINGNWYKAGAKVGDATIVAIEPTVVRVEWDGKETVFAPIAASSGGSREEQAKPATVEKKEGKVAEAVSKVESADVVRVRRSAVEEDPLGWIGVPLSPRMREKLMEKWNEASEEERREAKEQFGRMSPSEKREALDSLRGEL